MGHSSPMCVRLPPELDEQVRSFFAEHGLKVSEGMRRIVEEWAAGYAGRGAADAGLSAGLAAPPTGDPVETQPWLLFDAEFPPEAFARLSALGVRALHAGEEGLARAGPEALIEYALEDDCVIVTRNETAFRSLESAYAGARPFPPVLLLSASVPPEDAEANAQAIIRWLERRPRGRSADASPWVTSMEWLL